MPFNACASDCKGPFADLTASRSVLPHECKSRDEQRFQSVVQRLNDGSQQAAPAALRQPSYSPALQRHLPPPKTRKGHARISDPLPSIARAPGGLGSYPYPAVYSPQASDHYRSGPSAQRSTFSGAPSFGPIAPASGSDKQRISSA